MVPPRVNRGFDPNCLSRILRHETDRLERSSTTEASIRNAPPPAGSAEVDNVSSAQFVARNHANRFGRLSRILRQPRRGDEDVFFLALSASWRDRQRECGTR